MKKEIQRNIKKKQANKQVKTTAHNEMSLIVLTKDNQFCESVEKLEPFDNNVRNVK